MEGGGSAVSAVEKRLGKFYNLDVAIPQSVMPTVVNVSFDNRQQERRRDMPHGGISKKLEALDDDLVSYGQRERIAAAMLKGKMDSTASAVGIRGEKTGNELISGLDEESTVLTNFMDAQRSKIHGPNFLGVSCFPVEVHQEHPREVIEKERQRIRAIHGKEVLYSWGGATLQPVTDTVELSTRTVGTEESMGRKDASLHATIKKWRQDNIEKSKNELKEMAVEVQKRKKAELEAVEMKIKHKKGLTEFRDKLKERLRDRKDPLQGPVMRRFNDDSAQEFMDKFTGYQMSLDAALNMIGAP